MENQLDTSAFHFDYTNFDGSLGTSTGLTPLATTGGSTPPNPLSLFPNGSVDSVISLDMDDGPQGRRSSSEEKESLTPAQSRRKAQNRAA